MTVSEVNIWL